MSELYSINGTESAEDVVSRFMRADKYLHGQAVWSQTNEREEYRIKYPVCVDGTIVNSTFDVTAYPTLGLGEGFTITLNFPPCVWRLDYEPAHKFHINPIKEMSDFDGIVYGPHYHSWEDNKHLASANTLPGELNWARPLPVSVRTFDQALRWFVDRTNIVLSEDQIIDWPSVGRML